MFCWPSQHPKNAITPPCATICVFITTFKDLQGLLLLCRYPCTSTTNPLTQSPSCLCFQCVAQLPGVSAISLGSPFLQSCTILSLNSYPTLVLLQTGEFWNWFIEKRQSCDRGIHIPIPVSAWKGTRPLSLHWSRQIPWLRLIPRGGEANLGEWEQI